MIPLEIGIPEDDPSIEEFLARGKPGEPDPDLSPTSPYLETLTRAIESEKGIAVVCGSESNAIAMRHRLYKVRKKAIEGGNESFHQLTISIVAAPGQYELHLKKIPFEVRDL